MAERLRVAVEQTIRARQARRDQRQQLAAAREHGLHQRHTTKLARAEHPTQEATPDA